MFSTASRSADFTMPESGRIVAGGGHLHGGGLRLELSDQTCGRSSSPPSRTWGLPVVKVVHGLGRSMTTLSTTDGSLPPLRPPRLTATYENVSAAHPGDGDLLLRVSFGPGRDAARPPARCPTSEVAAAGRPAPLPPWRVSLSACCVRWKPWVSDFAYGAAARRRQARSTPWRSPPFAPRRHAW